MKSEKMIDNVGIIQHFCLLIQLLSDMLSHRTDGSANLKLMKKKLLFFLISFCVTTSMYAQQRTLSVNTSLVITDGNLEEATLTLQDKATGKKQKIQETDSLYKNKELHHVWKTYKLTLPYNQNFIFIFSNPGYVTRKIWLDTTLPEGKTWNDSVGFGIGLAINPNGEIEEPKNPDLKLKYSELLNEFVWESDNKLNNNNFYNKGVEKSKEGDYKGAIDEFTMALKGNQNDIDSWYNRGIMKLKLNDKEGACADWNIIKVLGKSDADELLKKYCENK